MYCYYHKLKRTIVALKRQTNRHTWYVELSLASDKFSSFEWILTTLRFLLQRYLWQPQSEWIDHQLFLRVRISTSNRLQDSSRTSGCSYCRETSQGLSQRTGNYSNQEVQEHISWKYCWFIQKIQITLTIKLFDWSFRLIRVQ